MTALMMLNQRPPADDAFTDVDFPWVAVCSVMAESRCAWLINRRAAMAHRGTGKKRIESDFS
jgi:hypothetical protein